MNQEKYKHQCAVRQMLRYRHKWCLSEFQRYVRNEKTIKLWLKLQDDFVIQWRLGNRGEIGRWIQSRK